MAILFAMSEEPSMEKMEKVASVIIMCLEDVRKTHARCLWYRTRAHHVASRQIPGQRERMWKPPVYDRDANDPMNERSRPTR